MSGTTGSPASWESSDRVLSTRLARSSGWLLAARLAPGVGQFTLILLAARRAGPALAGLLSLASVLSQYAATIVDFGAGDLSLLRGGQSSSLSRYRLALVRSKTALSAGVAASLGATALFLGKPVAPVLATAGLLGAMAGLTPVLTARLILLNRTRTEAAIAWADLAAGVGTSAFLLSRTAVPPPWLLVLILAASRATANAARLLAIPTTRHPQDPPISTTRLIREGFPFLSFALLMVLFLQGDVLLLSAFASIAVVGLYQVAWRCVYYSSVAAEALVAVLLPRVAGRLARNASPLRLTGHILSIFALLALTAFPVLWLVLPSLITLVFGQAFAPATTLVRILAIGMTIRFISYGAGLMLTATEHQTWKALAATAYTPLTLLFMAIGAAAAGARGTAVARVLGELVVLSTYLILLRRVLRSQTRRPVAFTGFFGELPPGELAKVIQTSQSSVDDAIANALAQAWDSETAEREREGSIKAAAIAPIIWRLPGARVLDAGCGLGSISRWMAWAGATVVSLDRVEERTQITRARLRAANAGPLPATVLVGDLVELPLVRDSFDIVTCVGVLEWIPVVGRTGDRSSTAEQMQEQVLREFARVLKPGGTLLVAIENRFGLPYLLGRRDEHTGLRWSTVLPRALARRYASCAGTKLAYTHSPRGLARLARRTGLAVEEIYAAMPHYASPSALFALKNGWPRSVDLVRRLVPFSAGRPPSRRWAWRLALGPLRSLTRRAAPSLVAVLRKSPGPTPTDPPLPLALVGPKGAGRSALALEYREPPECPTVARIPMSPTLNEKMRVAFERSMDAALSLNGRSVRVPAPVSLDHVGNLTVSRTELVDGQNLANALAARPWPARRRLARQVLRAFADASSHIPPHNDPSPVNMLTCGRQFILVDWDAANPLDDPVLDIAFLGIALANFVEPGRLGTVDSDLWLHPRSTRLWPELQEAFAAAETTLGLPPGSIEAALPRVMAAASARQNLTDHRPLLR